jgi:host factor-I protein
MIGGLHRNKSMSEPRFRKGACIETLRRGPAGDGARESQAKSSKKRRPDRAIGPNSNLTISRRWNLGFGPGRGIGYNDAMPLKSPVRQRRKSPPPGETGQESLYLRFLSEKQVAVTVKLHDGEVVYGWIEYFDDRMIRLTREGKPNLFIYKNQIRTIVESFRTIEARRRDRQRGASANGALPLSAENGIRASVKQGLLAPAQAAVADFGGTMHPAAEAHQSSEEPNGA